MSDLEYILIGFGLMLTGAVLLFFAAKFCERRNGG
jgi:hypothetical protein